MPRAAIRPAADHGGAGLAGSSRSGKRDNGGGGLSLDVEEAEGAVSCSIGGTERGAEGAVITAPGSGLGCTAPYSYRGWCGALTERTRAAGWSRTTARLSAARTKGAMDAVDGLNENDGSVGPPADEGEPVSAMQGRTTGDGDGSELCEREWKTVVNSERERAASPPSERRAGDARGVTSDVEGSGHAEAAVARCMGAGMRGL